MGCMSASDAAPLPRLGEVFFDVRGDSRSMRLSWYADTGVAVFSIWQGGTCTGTFRLPMDDLARMIESLRRGPQGQRTGRRDAPGEPGQQAPPGRAAAGDAAAGGPDEGQATMAMRMPAGSGARRGPRARRPAPDGRARTRGTRPRRRGLRDGPSPHLPGESGGYPIDPLDPAYPVPAAGYPDEPSTGAYRRPAQGYGPGTGYPRPGYPEGPAAADYRRAAAAGYQDPPATGDYRGGQSGSHRREPGDFPARPRPGPRATTGSPPRRSTAMRTRAAGTRPRLPGRPGHRGLPRRASPGATAARRAAGTRVTPLTIPIPASRALRIIPAKRPATTPALIRPGRIMARARSGMTRLTTPWRATAVSPGNPSPMGARPAIPTTGNGDAIPAVIDG